MSWRQESSGANRWSLTVSPFRRGDTTLDAVHEPLSEFGMTRQFDAIPAREARERANPKSAVACANHSERELLRQLLPGRWLPGHSANSIESEQAELPAEPEIPVRCLSHAEDIASREPIPGGPRGMRVLADSERRIESGSARAAGQQNTGQSASSSA